MKRIWFLLGAVIGVLASGILIANIARPEPDGEYIAAVSIQQLKKSERFINTLEIESAIIQGVSEKRELIVMAAEAEETVTVDNSWTELEIFKLSQKVKYIGRGIFTTDLTDGFSVEIDQLDKSVSVIVAKPKLKTIEILEDRTEFQPVQRGALRFDGISVSLESSNILMLSVKESMKESLLTEELNEEARKHTVSAVSGIVADFLEQNNLKYTINVSFAGETGA